MFIRRVEGDSMAPALRAGDIVIATRGRIIPGRIVVAKVTGREVVKRVQRIEGARVYLLGDNRQESTDSRHYGPLDKSAILGRIMIVLPKATHPPKLVKPYGLWCGRLAALILAAFALIHLFRIDTFIPILDNVLPGGQVAASLAAILIVMTEIFAIPFALRMKLSPLAHVKSGALVVFAPLWWLLITVWSFGLPISTGQLGEFVEVYATPVTLIFNLAWLAFSYYTIYLLGYNSFQWRTLLRK